MHVVANEQKTAARQGVLVFQSVGICNVLCCEACGGLFFAIESDYNVVGSQVSLSHYSTLCDA
jgi:hypothetical protein